MKYRVVENDRMYRKQKTIAAQLHKEEAQFIQILKYKSKNADPYIQYAIEAEITERWGRNV